MKGKGEGKSKIGTPVNDRALRPLLEISICALGKVIV